MDFVVIFDKGTFKFIKLLATVPPKPQDYEKKPILQDLCGSVEFIFYGLKKQQQQ